MKDKTPIEEWLLKFGFVECYNYWTLGNFQLDKIDEDVVFNYGNENCGTLINSVHQLQNLYFALTNEELKHTSKL